VIRRLIAPILDGQKWAEDLGGTLIKIYLFFLRPAALKSFLHGTWLGHALHPLLTDVPVGAFTVALFLDILGGFGNTAAYEGAKWATVVGVVTMLGAALAGIADFTGTYGRETRYGTLHQIFMYLSLVLYLLSLAVRFGLAAGGSQLWTASAAIGYGLLAIGAYIGGELVFGLGYMVDRHVWDAGGAKWAALERSEFPENEPTQAKAGDQTLLIVRQGERIYAMHDVCSHAGCNLSDGGTIVGSKRDQIQCPCHGSRFRLKNGTVARGPATYDQPSFEVRRGERGIEVRKAKSA